MAFAGGLNRKYRGVYQARAMLAREQNAKRASVIGRKKNVRGGITMGVPQNEGFVPLHPIDSKSGRTAFQSPTKHGVYGARKNLQHGGLKRAIELGRQETYQRRARQVRRT